MLEINLYRMTGEFMKSRKIMMTVLSIVAILSIGGCAVKHKEDTKQEKKIVSSSSSSSSSTKDVKEDKETIKKKQLNYLKEHQQEIVDLVKAQNSKVESVQIDWDSMIIEESGNGTPQGGGYNLSISGQVNHLENTKFSVDFYLENRESLPNIDRMGMLNDIYIDENGGWKIF